MSSQPSLTQALACNAKSVLFTGIACTQAVMSLAFQSVPRDTLVLGSTFDKLSDQTAKCSIDILNKAMITAGECGCTGADDLVSNAAVALAHLTSTTAVVAANLLIPDSVRERVDNSVDDMDDETKVAEVQAGAYRFLEHLKNDVGTVEDLEAFLKEFAEQFQDKIHRAKDAIIGQDDGDARFKSEVYSQAIEKAIETVRCGTKALHAAGAYEFSFNDDTLDGETLEAGNAVDLCTFDPEGVDLEKFSVSDSSDAGMYWKDVCETMVSFCDVVNIFVRMILYCSAYRQTLNRIGYFISFDTKKMGYKVGIVEGVYPVDYATVQVLMSQVETFVSKTKSEFARKLLHKTKSECEYIREVLGHKDLANKVRCVAMQEAILKSSELRRQQASDRYENELELYNAARGMYAKATSSDYREMSAYKSGDIEKAYASMSDPGADVDGLFTTVAFNDEPDPVLNGVMRILEDHLQLRNNKGENSVPQFELEDVLSADKKKIQDLKKLTDIKQVIDEITDDQTHKKTLSSKTLELYEEAYAAFEVPLNESSQNPQTYVKFLLRNGAKQLTKDETKEEWSIFMKDVVGEGTKEFSEEEVFQLLANRILNKKSSTDLVENVRPEQVDHDKALHDAHDDDDSSLYKDKDLNYFWSNHTLPLEADASRWTEFTNFITEDGTKTDAKFDETSIDFRRVVLEELLLKDRGIASKLFNDPVDGKYDAHVWAMGRRFLNERRMQYYSIKVQVHEAMAKGWSVGAGDIVTQFSEEWDHFLSDLKSARDQAAERKHRAELTYREAGASVYDSKRKLNECKQQERAALAIMRQAHV